MLRYADKGCRSAPGKSGVRTGRVEMIADRSEDGAGVEVKDRAEHNIFIDVEAPLHAFDPADEGLILAIGLGQIPLGQAQFLPPPDQLFDDLDIGLGEQGLPRLRHGQGLFQGVFA